MDLALTGAIMLEQKGAISKLFPLIVENEVVSWYADTLRVPFNGTKWSNSTPEKQDHTINPLHEIYSC